MAATGGSGDNKQATETQAFDAATFKKEILDEMNKSFNGMQKGLFKDFEKMMKAASKGSAEPESHESEEAKSGNEAKNEKGGSTEVQTNTKVQFLEKQVKVLMEQNAEAAKAAKAATDARLESERQTSIRNVLNGINFRDQESRDLVFKSVLPDIKRNDSGELIADSTTGPIAFDAHIKSAAEKFPYLLAPNGGGGAGATGGGITRGTGKHLNLDTMNVADYQKMSKEEQAEVGQHLARELGTIMGS